MVYAMHTMHAGLTISHKKTQLIQFSGDPAGNQWCKLDNRNAIESVSQMRYLGVVIDRRLDWKEHIKQLVGKLDRLNNALNWILKSCKTAHIQEKFILYRSVIVANVTYAAELWSGVLKINRYRTMLNRAQRKPLLAITRAYKSTSYEKLFLVTGLVTYELEAIRKRMSTEKEKELGRKLNCEEKREIDDLLNRENQKNYTKKLNVDIKPDFRGAICPELVYILTGHGPFRSHLKRIGVEEADECRLCSAGRETVEHFQAGCRGVQFKIAGKVENESELAVLIENSKQLIRRLRTVDTPVRPDVH